MDQSRHFDSDMSADGAAEQAKTFKDELMSAAQASNLTSADEMALFERLHFATSPVTNQPGWLPDLLQDWPSNKHVINIHNPGDGNFNCWLLQFISGGPVCAKTLKKHISQHHQCDWLFLASVNMLLIVLEGPILLQHRPFGRHQVCIHDAEHWNLMITCILSAEHSHRVVRTQAGSLVQADPQGTIDRLN